MYGLFIAMIGLMTFAIAHEVVDLTSGRENPARTVSLPPSEETIAESVAGAMQWSFADAVSACTEKLPGTAPAACQPGAPSGPLITNATDASASLGIYAAGTQLGVVRTYYISGAAGAAYIAATWIPATAGLATRYCAAVLRDLSRLTGAARWVAPYESASNAVFVYGSSTTAAPLQTQGISLGAPAGALTNGCPVMLEPVVN